MGHRAIQRYEIRYFVRKIRQRKLASKACRWVADSNRAKQ